MCGEVRFEGYKAVRSEELPDEMEICDLKGVTIPGPRVFNGHTTRENLKDWVSRGWKPGFLRADGFRERETDFDVPEDEGIGIVFRHLGGKTRINIVTRPATEEEEALCGHDRMPSLGPLPVTESKDAQ